MMFLRRPRFFEQWLESRLPHGESVALTSRSVYIVPTRAGLGFAALLLMMLLGAINYTNSLAFSLTFLLGAMALVSALHAQRNLVELILSAGRAEPVFAGETARFEVVLRDPGRRGRYALTLAADGIEPVCAEVQAGNRSSVFLNRHAPRRGLMPLGRLRIATRYPLGLFRSWSELVLDVRCVVYPSPEAGHPPLPVDPLGEQGGQDPREGQDDFAGLRDYRPGDSPRHVAWKAVARGHGAFTKQFAGEVANRRVQLDWNALTGLAPEQRAARLCRWILDAEGLGYAYGLRLPGREIPAALGEAHRARCLEALALYDIDR